MTSLADDIVGSCQLQESYCFPSQINICCLGRKILKPKLSCRQGRRTLLMGEATCLLQILLTQIPLFNFKQVMWWHKIKEDRQYSLTAVHLRFQILNVTKLRPPHTHILKLSQVVLTDRMCIPIQPRRLTLPPSKLIHM